MRFSQTKCNLCRISVQVILSVDTSYWSKIVLLRSSQNSHAAPQTTANHRAQLDWNRFPPHNFTYQSPRRYAYNGQRLRSTVVPIVAFDMRAGSRSDALSSNPIPNGLAEHPGFDSTLEFDLPLCFVV